MILTVEQNRPCKLFDATGKPVLDCIWADTETGEVVQYLRDDTGRFVINADGVARERRTVPAPLRVEGLKK